ncbi:hypothetical protein TRVA0_044S00144 [Trichomonascus vanleenenianus]|uniref:uncharacterized protein n=1 Tax=Trichomonascus vanleenenianus TaxID=2268995 RepID=UPI003EC9979F
MWTDVALGVLFRVVDARKNTLKLVLTSGTSEGVDIYASFFRESFPHLRILSLESTVQDVDALFLEEPPGFGGGGGGLAAQVIKHTIRIHGTVGSSESIAVLLPTKKLAIETAEGVNLHFRGEGARIIIHHGDGHSKLPPVRTQFILFWGGAAIERMGLPEQYLDAITVVVDSGKEQVRRYSNGSVSVLNEAIPKPVAFLRQSLAGVSHPGKCYHLTPLESLPASFSPEIHRSDMTEPILALLSLGFSNLARAKIFVNNPSPESVAAALTKLAAFGFISRDDTKPTKQGIVAAKLPIPPEFARAITSAQYKSCVREILLITAASLAGGIEALVVSSDHRSKFAAIQGDHLTALNVMVAYVDSANPAQFSNSMGFNNRALSKARSIYTQLSAYVAANGLNMNKIAAKPEAVLDCLAAGFVFNVAKRKSINKYELINGDTAILHKSSIIHEVNDAWALTPASRPSPWCIYEELSEVSSGLALKMVSIVERSMLPSGVYTSS